MRKDVFPLPWIKETFEALSGARWFSTLDLASGYNQVPVSEKNRSKTACCIPFGLCNVSSTFQHLMQRMFGDQQCQSLLLYLDDITVFSSSFPLHVLHLEVIFDCLQREGLKVKLEKCQFLRQHVNYLGHGLWMVLPNWQDLFISWGSS